MNLPLGNVAIDGTSYPLSLEVKVEDWSIEAVVRLPSTYPNTTFAKKYRKEVASITMSLLPHFPPHHTEAFDKAAHLFGVGPDTKVVTIDFFDGVSPHDRHLLTEAEARGFRGIARRALCAMLHYVNASHPAYQDSLVYLNACGSVTKGRRPTIQTARHRRALRRNLIRENTDRKAQGLYRTANNNTLALKMMELEQNKALERMYNRAFGFRLLVRKRICSYMAVPLQVALRKCS